MFIFSTSSSCGFVITVVLKAKWELSPDRGDDGDDGVKYNTKIILTKKKFYYIFKTAFEIWWHTRRNQISSFGETDGSI